MKVWIQLMKIYDSPVKSVNYHEFIEDVGEDDTDFLLSKKKNYINTIQVKLVFNQNQ